MNDDPRQWLQAYVRDGSETAFRDLVSHYSGFVYSVALRLAAGNTLLAQEISQTVFTDLAQKAHRLSSEVPVSGWLHRHTCFVASTHLRSERRRREREQKAAEIDPCEGPPLETEQGANLVPVLDEAINSLQADDRFAILWRFYEQLDFRSIGARLGTGEDAARMRVNRALDKLRIMLKRRGVETTTGALGMTLGSCFLISTPPGLAAAIASTAFGTTAAGAGLSLNPLLFTTMLQSLQFTEQGRLEFGKITRENLNKRLAMSIDGESYAAPIIRGEINGGKAVISGKFSETRAQELVSRINNALQGL